MSEPLFTISDSFYIKGRGLVLLITEDPSADHPVVVKIGDRIELTTPAGEVCDADVKGVEILHWSSPRTDIAPFGILVPKSAEDGARLRGGSGRVVRNES